MVNANVCFVNAIFCRGRPLLMILFRKASEPFLSAWIYTHNQRDPKYVVINVWPTSFLIRLRHIVVVSIFNYILRRTQQLEEKGVLAQQFLHSIYIFTSMYLLTTLKCTQLFVWYFFTRNGYVFGSGVHFSSVASI